MIFPIILGFILGICQVAASEPGLRRRDLFDNSFYVWDTEGDWACTEAQVNIIKEAITETHALAQVAIDFLSKRGSEKDAIYARWFGSGNANVERRNIILKQHYESVLSNLIPPTKKAFFLIWGIPSLSGREGSTVTEKSLVYACAPKSESLCKGDHVAGVDSRTEDEASSFGATVLMFCPAFFRRTPNMDTYAKTWLKDHELGEVIPRAFSLIHELQHMIEATGDGERCDDLSGIDELEFQDGVCYSADCCARLSDSDKLKNAQNYAIFALDVLANPPSSSSCAIMRKKRQELPGSIFSISTTFKTLHTPQNWLQHTTPNISIASPASVSSSPSSPLLSTPAATFQGNPSVPNIPFPPSSSHLTTQAITTTPSDTTSSTRRTTSSVPTYIVEGGATIVVVVGAIVKGGEGGGFFILGGNTVQVAEGDTITASAENQPKTKTASENPTSETPTSCGQPTTTSSSIVYGKVANFGCVDLFAKEMDGRILRRIRSSNATPFGTPTVTSAAAPTTTLEPTSATTTTSSQPLLPPKPQWANTAGWEKVFEADGVASWGYDSTYDSLSDGLQGDPEQWCLDKCGDGCSSIYLLRQLQITRGEYNPYYTCALYSAAWSDDWQQVGFEGRVDSGVAFNKV